jgi:hypothetical protein
MTFLPYRISLTSGWSTRASWDTIVKWCNERGILNGEWDYYTVGAVTESPVIGFKHEVDAVAFKLRFEL